jgi:predicted RNase H-like HicB family nuclease
MAQLSDFKITRAPDDEFSVMIEDDDGNSFEFEASIEQLDLIKEAVDEHLEDEVEDHELADDDDDEVEEL